MSWGWIWPIIPGILAILVARLVGKMLTRPIMARHIIIGSIQRSIQHSMESWCIPVHVKVNILWWLLIGELKDVAAFITFIQQKDGEKNQIKRQTVWINPNVEDDSFISLHIGSKRHIGLAQKSDFEPNTLLIYGDELGPSPNVNIRLSGDYDVLLELRSDDKMLGCWKFQKAIVGGIVQEVNPLKISSPSTSHKEVIE